MKKTLLLSAIALVAFVSVNAQGVTKVWNFSEAPFGASPSVVLTSTSTVDGLTVGTDGTALFTLTANTKTIDGVTYTYRLQTGGGGAPVAPSLIPTTRYLAFNVGGQSTINVGMMSSNATSTRTLIIVNENQSVIDSIVNIDGAAAAKYTYTYTGAASKIYLYSRSSGINYYYVSATNVVMTSVKSILADKGVSFNGVEITNSNGLELEVYNVLGKKVASAATTISTKGFQKGVYIVRVKGSNDALKFSI